MSPKDSNISLPPKGGTFQGFIDRVKLVLRLMADRRVNPLLKLLPVGALIYVISPVDLLPGLALPVIGALDDAAVLWLGTTLFVELCPPDVVSEHMRQLQGGGQPPAGEDVVDAEVRDVTDGPQK